MASNTVTHAGMLAAITDAADAHAGIHTAVSEHAQKQADAAANSRRILEAQSAAKKLLNESGTS